MGLDGVELVLAVEKEFKIDISDSDAEQCFTIGNLVDLVYARLRHNVDEPCPSQQGFYVVRRQMVNLLGLKRSQIKPETRFEDIIDRKNRRKMWRDLVRSLTGQKTFRLSLVHSKWMNLLVILVFPATTFVCIVAFTWLPFEIALFLAVIVGIIGNRLTVPFKREFPAEFSQVQNLIRFVKTLDLKTWTKEEVFQKIKKITVDLLGVKESQVTLDARFVDDLEI